jgi:uncharacterized protein (TIGR02444 family)
MSDPDSLEEQSWAFALQIYAEPGVAEACLRLQDEAGVDVMLLLTVAFSCHRGIPISSADIAAMDESCRPWREQIVKPLRALRTALKSGPRPAPNAVTEILRNQVKASELLAERLANDLLAAELQSRAGAPRPVTADERRAALRQVVDLALPGPRPMRIDDFASLIEVLVAAVSRVAT